MPILHSLSPRDVTVQTAAASCFTSCCSANSQRISIQIQLAIALRCSVPQIATEFFAGAKTDSADRGQLWCWQLWHVRTSLQPQLPLHVAQCSHQCHGRRPGCWCPGHSKHQSRACTQLARLGSLNKSRAFQHYDTVFYCLTGSIGCKLTYA